MTRPLSTDLREGVVLAVEGGQSRRCAAKVFGVAAATAIRWVEQWRRSGSVAPKAQGGDNRSHRIEAYAEEILSLIDEVPDITLAGIVAHLDERQGLKVAQSTVWRLLDRRGLTFKKNPHTPVSRSGLTFCAVVKPGSTRRATWTSSGWSSSTRPGLRPRWPGAMAGRLGASVVALRCRMVTGRPRPSSARSDWRG